MQNVAYGLAKVKTVKKEQQEESNMKGKLGGFIFGILFTAMLMGLTGTALALKEDRAANLYYNDIRVTLNDKELRLLDAAGNPVEPFIIDGTTYLPVRAISEALGLEVGWDGETSTVKLTTEDYHLQTNDFETEATIQNVVSKADKVDQTQTSTPEKEPEPSQKPTSSSNSKTSSSQSTSKAPDMPNGSQIVYITKTGKRYHYDSTCNGGTYFQTSLSDAKSRGLTPCQKCVAH